jgi:hypothetical protein
LNRRLDERQDRCGGFGKAKNLVLLPIFEPWTVQPVPFSLYPPNYPGTPCTGSVILYRVQAIPCTGLERPLGFPEVEDPNNSRQSAHDDKVVSPTHRPPLSPKKYSWYSFLLEAESTPGPQYGHKDYINAKSQ